MYPSKGAPRILTAGSHARDITKEFTQAASYLKTGQLVKDELFTLFEAVGALEIMDSKMDSGYLAAGETLDDEYDVMRELLPEEIVGIMDQLLCLEVGWQMGHPLSLTIFTSIYLDRLLWPVPKTLQDARFSREQSETSGNKSHGRCSKGSELVSIVLRAYCLALIKSCDLVMERICYEYYYEEEDFVTQTYSRKLLSDIKPSEFYDNIDNALSWLEGREQQINKSMMDALRTRLLYRREFLLTLESGLSMIQNRDLKSVRACLGYIGNIQKSMALGKPVEASISSKIQRRLASTVPPRPIVTVEPGKAIDFLKRLFQDSIDIHEILDSSNPYDLQQSVWIFQSRKPQSSVYIRCLTQSLLLNEMRVLGSQSLKKFCYQDLTNLVLPWSTILDEKHEEIEVPSDTRFQIAKQMDTFIKRVAQPFIDTYRASCLNRCRIRRMLCHTIMDWDHLRAEAEDIDTRLRDLTSEPAIKTQDDEPTYSYPLSSWVYNQTLRQVRLILQLGFELSIYSPEELSGTYWYLSYICGTHISHLERIQTCVECEYQRSVDEGNEMTATQKKERDQAFRKTRDVLRRLRNELARIDAFAMALHSLYLLLMRYDLVPSGYLASSKRYSSEKLRYELRMKPMFSISLPDPLPFEFYEVQSTSSELSDERILERALLAVGEAKKYLEASIAEGPFLDPKARSPKREQDESPTIFKTLRNDWTADMKNTLRSCIATSIAIGTFKKAFTASTTPASAGRQSKGNNNDAARPRLNLVVEIPEVGSKSRWHDWWIVPTVSETLPLRTR